MGLLILMRIFAQIIDISIYFATLVISYIYILPYFLVFFKTVGISGFILFIFTVLVVFVFQYPFLKVNQTIGKAFFGLKIQSTNSDRELDLGILMQREILAKLMSCYFICLPVLVGKKGGHEIGTETEVVKKRMIKKRNIRQV